MDSPCVSWVCSVCGSLRDSSVAAEVSTSPGDLLDTLPEMEGSGGTGTDPGQVPSLQYLVTIWDGLKTLSAGLIAQQVNFVRGDGER